MRYINIETENRDFLIGQWVEQIEKGGQVLLGVLKDGGIYRAAISKNDGIPPEGLFPHPPAPVT